MGTVNKVWPNLVLQEFKMLQFVKLIKQSEKIQMQIIQSNALMMTVKEIFY